VRVIHYNECACHLRGIIGLLLSRDALCLRDAVHNRLWGWKGRGGNPGLAPLQGANFFRRSYRGLRCAGPRLFTRAPSGLSLFVLRMAKLQRVAVLGNPGLNDATPLGLEAERAVFPG